MEIHIFFKYKQTFKNIHLQTPNTAALAAHPPFGLQDLQRRDWEEALYSGERSLLQTLPALEVEVQSRAT